MNENQLTHLLRMIDEAETIPDMDLKALLNDKENRAYYETMVMIKQAFHAEPSSSPKNYRLTMHRYRRWPRFVYTVAVALFALVSIVFATVHFWNTGERVAPSVDEESTVVDQKLTSEGEKTFASIPKKIYDDETLEVILSDMASFYGLEVKYSDRSKSALRLHFVWNPADDIDTVIEIFNHFVKIKISHDGNVLYVK